jgi:hypothetical protein
MQLHSSFSVPNQFTMLHRLYMSQHRYERGERGMEETYSVRELSLRPRRPSEPSSSCRRLDNPSMCTVRPTSHISVWNARKGREGTDLVERSLTSLALRPEPRIGRVVRRRDTELYDGSISECISNNRRGRAGPAWNEALQSSVCNSHTQPYLFNPISTIAQHQRE